MRSTSFTFRVLSYLGFRYSVAKYGHIGVLDVFRKIFLIYRNEFLLRYVMNSYLLEPIAPRFLRPSLLRFMGANVGRGVFIGANVSFDSGHLSKLTIEDGVHIAAQTSLLFHQRDLSTYQKGVDYSDLGYRVGPIHLMKGCLIGQRSMIMPGVTVGPGALVGAFSLVTKDIPEWTISVGRPATVVKLIK